MTAAGSQTRADIVLALGQLVILRVISRYETNFHEMRKHGVAPVVRVWIRQRDELSIARVRRRIRDLLPLHLKGLQVEIVSDPPLRSLP